MGTMAEEQEALFQAYPCAVYYVQSPSVASHVNSPDCSPAAFNPAPPAAAAASQEVARLTLSRYSSSRGSNNSFLHEKKLAYDLNGSIEIAGCRLVDHPSGDGDDEDEDRRSKPGLLSFGYSSAWYCLCFQMVWRFALSFGISLLVFFLITRPPPPRISVTIAGIREFGLGEGVDASGVSTKILTSNCSIEVEVDNRSKYFGLHIRPPVMDMAFERLDLGTTEGPALYVKSYSAVSFHLYTGAKKRAIYGAGREMEDMLESGKGIPLVLHLRLSSYIEVVWNLIRPRFHHRVECLLLLRRPYDRKHHTQSFNSSCTVNSYK